MLTSPSSVSPRTVPRSLSWALALLLAASLTGLAAAGCVSPQRAAAPAPSPEPTGQAPDSNDAFALFEGARVEAGRRFRLREEPVGIESLRAVLKLIRVDWTTVETGTGETVSATVVLRVRRGETDRIIGIDAGDTDLAAGLSLQVLAAGILTDGPGPQGVYADLVVRAE